MRLPSCSKLSIGNVLEYLCWKWKPYPRVVFHESRLVWVLFYVRQVCCLWRVLTCVRVTNTFWWRWFLVISVLRKCVLGQVSLLSRCSPRYFTSSRGSCTLFIWHVSLHVVDVTWIDLDPKQQLHRNKRMCSLRGSYRDVRRSKITINRRKWSLVWRRVEYLHSNPVSCKGRRKWYPVPGGINRPPCSWEDINMT
jgi:hypothetical protein